MGLASLGGLPLVVDPTSVQWTFRMKTAEHVTLGGKVIQVYGTDLGDMTVSGVFGRGDARLGETASWEAMERFRVQVEAWATSDANSAHGAPLRFLYPSRKWDFKVHVKAYTSGGGEFEHSNGNINPRWTLTLFIVEDSTNRVVKGIQDMYLSRLMNGIGWKQTKYNGPNQAEVDRILQPYGGEVGTYLQSGLTGNTQGQAGGSNG